MKQHIYADNAATTQLDKTAFETMTPWLIEEYGNASQPYAFARKPKKLLQKQDVQLQNVLVPYLRRFFYFRRD